MRKYWRQIAAAVLAVILLLLGLDLRFGLFQEDGQYLPVLMYHHFEDPPDYGPVLTETCFREQMTALKNAGFSSVTLEQVRDYVYDGVPLPEKPVLITIDDGYTSNLTVAAPILEELGYQATVFVIGIYEGETIDPRDGNPICWDRFSYEEALPWVEKGVLDLQSHSFDMHRLVQDGVSVRDAMLPAEGETEDAYLQALQEDFDQFRQRREGRVPTELTALAFPYGYWNDTLNSFLAGQGILFTFTTVNFCTRLETGNPDCLYRMGRFNMTEHVSGEYLVKKLERAVKG
ncbi:MAG: polysaccharide deacetylase family protein, partial [Oscillospiraceae bacterium]|nr:polysaccharide deacetylase family protein [Oscillospiraceae bacterium]